MATASKRNNPFIFSYLCSPSLSFISYLYSYSYHLSFLNAQAKSQTLATGRRSLSATASSPSETAAFPDYVLRAPLKYITTLTPTCVWRPNTSSMAKLPPLEFRSMPITVTRPLPTTGLLNSLSLWLSRAPIRAPSRPSNWRLKTWVATCELF